MSANDSAASIEPSGSDSPTAERKNLTTATLEQLFGNLEGAQKKADEHVAAAAAAQVKADNEALRAYQAKQAVEEHSTAVAQLKGRAEADAATIAKYKADLESASQSVGNSKQATESDVTAIASLRKTAEEGVNGISAHQGTATAAVAGIEAVKNDMDRLVQPLRVTVKAVETELATATSLREQVAGDADTARNLATSIAGMHEQAKAAAESSAEHRDAAKASLESIADATMRVGETHAAVKAYEGELAQLRVDFTEIRKNVEALLPGATSASLASSFRVQKEKFRGPQRRWMWTFIVCMAYLTAISGIGVVGHWGGPTESWDAILRLIVQRLPLMLPAIWLAIYAGRQYMLAQRLEEDYANKEAISTAFEGYKREMGAIPSSGSAESPLLVLCHTVLTILARRPGRIYEGKIDDVTPFNAVGEGLSKVLPAVPKSEQSPHA